MACHDTLEFTDAELEAVIDETHRNGLPITAQVATCLYLSIAYDTNFFKYLRRRPETHRIAAELVERGADSDEVYRSAFASRSISQVALTGAVLRSYQLGEGGMGVVFASREISTGSCFEMWRRTSS